MDEDEWFFNSFKLYNELHMFDFPRNVAEIDLTSTNNLCVALEEDSSGRNEVLVFQLPSALQPKCNSGYTKLERNLSFDHGYFTESSLVQLKCTAHQDNLIISERNGVALFDLTCEDSDIIRKASDIPGEVERALIAVNPLNHNVILCDGGIGHRSVVDYEKMDVLLQLEDSSRELTVPMFSSVDVICFGNSYSGCVTSFDLRDGKQTSSVVVSDYVQDLVPKQWIFNSTFECSSEPTGLSYLYVWTDNGHLMLFDWRNTSQPLQHAKHFGYCKTSENCSRRISVCPLNSSLFAVSGFDQNVYIGELKNNEVVTVFTHDGHAYCHDEYEPNVKSHCSVWLPFISSNTMVSCANNASLQCWQYKIS